MRSFVNMSTIIVGALSCSALLLSCAEESVVADNMETETSDIPETIPTELPAYDTAANCLSEPPDPLTICEWATAPDAIVFAKVVDTRGFENPALKDDAVTRTCSRAIPGLEIDLVVLETLRGSAPTTLTFRISEETLSYWANPPYLDRDDLENPGWGTSAGHRVLPGMIYGLALYDVGESWTTAFDPWFARTASDEMALMEGTEQLCDSAPDWLEGMPLSDLKSSIAACSGTEGKERRDWVMTAAQSLPHQVYAAKCLD